MAGTLTGPSNLAGCNGLYLVLLLLGGMIVPFEKLPDPLGAVAELLPAAPLSDDPDRLAHAGPVGRTAGRGSCWRVGGRRPVAAARLFRWE